MTKKIVFLSILIMGLTACFLMAFPPLPKPLTEKEKSEFYKKLEWHKCGNVKTLRYPLIEISKNDPVIRVMATKKFSRNSEGYNFGLEFDLSYDITKNFRK